MISLGENFVQPTNHKENYMDIIKDEKEFKKKNQENIKAKKALAEKFFLNLARIAGVSAGKLELKGRGYTYTVMLAGVPLCLCSFEFTDGTFKWYDGKGYCTKWAMKSDNECDIHCGFFSAFGAMMGEDGTMSFKGEGESAKFENEVKERFKEISSRVVYNKDGIIAIADKQSRYGLVYVGKKEYRVEFYHDTKGALCFQIRNTKILATHFGTVSRLILNHIIPAMGD
jgi:hypothetical protein